MSGPILCELRPDVASAAPVFCVHPTSGEVSYYEELARHISGRAVIGLKAPWLDQSLPIPARIENIAETYLTAILARASGRPLLLVGWSGGAIIAYAMALRARELGHVVAGLALIEARAPQDKMLDAPPEEDPTSLKTVIPLLRRLAGLREQKLSHTEESLGRLSPDERIALIRDESIRTGLLPAGADVAAATRLLHTFHGLGRAFMAYRPPHFEGRLTLIEATQSPVDHPRPATLGWERCADQIESIVVDGDLFTMLHSKRAADVGRKLDHWAKRACP